MGALFVLAGCDSKVPESSAVAIDRPPVELPVRHEPRIPDAPEAPDFDVVFPEGQAVTLRGIEPCATWPDTTCTMRAGHYYSSEFHVAFDLLDGEWTNTVNWPNALELRDGPRSITFISGPSDSCSRWYANYYYWSCTSVGPPPPVTAAGLRRELREYGEVAVGRMDRSLRIDGRPTGTFDVRSTAEEEWPVSIVTIQSGGYSLGPGQSLRLSILEIDGESVILALEAPTKSFEAYVAAMQPVLDSIEFEDFR